MFNHQIYFFMSKSHKPIEDYNSQCNVIVHVTRTCVVTLTRPSTNPEKPLQRQYLAYEGEEFQVLASPESPVTIGVLPFSELPESLKLNCDELHK